MELNWTTFILEILNFLVLVWLLQHLFYRPVKEMIARRQQGIEAQLAEAGARRDAAETLRRDYESRLADWEQEQRQSRAQLAREVEEERAGLMARLQDELAAERKKNEVLAARQAEEQLHRNEGRALALGARFVALLLNKLGSADLEQKLIELLMREVRELPAEQKTGLEPQAENDQPQLVRITSAYPMDEGVRTALQSYLASLLPCPARCEFTEDRQLIAGLRITVGPWVIHANLQDELKVFSSLAYEQD